MLGLLLLSSLSYEGKTNRGQNYSRKKRITSIESITKTQIEVKDSNPLIKTLKKRWNIFKLKTRECHWQHFGAFIVEHISHLFDFGWGNICWVNFCISIQSPWWLSLQRYKMFIVIISVSRTLLVNPVRCLIRKILRFIVAPSALKLNEHKTSRRRLIYVQLASCIQGNVLQSVSIYFKWPTILDR